MAGFADAQWTRVTGAGVDPHEYRRVTGGLASVADWGPAFLRAGQEHLGRAEGAGSPRSAGTHLLAAARCFHVATLAPYAEAARAAAAADDALGRALAVLEPGARRVSGEGFTGWLRFPSAAPGASRASVASAVSGASGADVPGADAVGADVPGADASGADVPGADAVGTVIVVPGLDSAKEEFLDLVSALLARGLAVFAMDGPGQGVLAATSVLVPEYEKVVGRVLDALGVPRAGLVGLSLGGYFAARAAALEPRVAAVATVSGPFRLDWNELPQPIRDMVARRTGGADAAREFTRHVDLTGLAPRVTAPLLVVDGGQDVIPGVTNGEPLARSAPHGTHLSVPHGDHLLGNARPDWLPRLADHLAHALTGA
ncbi:alpha/beta fold hydrolase [Streptomyces bikiniensis]|uniref:alpha/beta fold hydrolase n=1 Tax=Streptomyces bikiniensis TaxID=1896 RepID=UPI00055B4265|nr:alpha/beta fold hydrolase [Streptomyces bikiniensis]